MPSVDDRQAALVHFIGGVSPAEAAALREALDAMAGTDQTGDATTTA